MPGDPVQSEPLPRVALGFGGKVLRFEPADPSVAFTLHGVHSRFVSPEDLPADCVVTCAFGEPRPAPLSPIYAGQDAWDLRVLESGAQEVCYYSANPGGRIPWATLTLEPSFRAATLVRRPLWGGEPTLRVGFPFDEYLMCRLLARDNGFVVHAAAIEQDGMGLLFVGHSGAGKSTMSDIAERVGARVLSDDRAIVTMKNDRLMVWGSPWHGSQRKGAAVSAPLCGAFLLTQDVEDSIHPMAPGRALGELFVRLIHPSVDADETAGVLETLGALVAALPVHELRFRPTPHAFRLAVACSRARTPRVTHPPAWDSGRAGSPA
jgi:hypothetical protein